MLKTNTGKKRLKNNGIYNTFHGWTTIPGMDRWEIS